jgi:hypothetical protein
MNPAWEALALTVGLFVAMLFCLEMGYRIGLGALTRDRQAAHEGVGAMETATFALFGLLLGFSFAGATARLDVRRELIVREANAIGTAYLRVDLLPPSDQPPMRDLFRRYLDARIAMYARLPNMEAANHELARAEGLQQEIWSHTIREVRTDSAGNVAKLLLPALNDMIDITTTRSIALRTRLPTLIFTLLISLALMSGLLAGYSMAKRRHRSWVHGLLYASFISITIYTVLDLDHPRSGLIRLDAADSAIVKLRNSIS